MSIYIIYIYIYIYIHTYIHTYSPHLGLINAPPLICCFPPNDLFHYEFTIKNARHLLKSGQDFINLTGDTSCSSWGSSWGSSIFSQSENPQEVISCTYKALINRSLRSNGQSCQRQPTTQRASEEKTKLPPRTTPFHRGQVTGH